MSNEREVMSDRVAGKTETRVPRGVLCVGAIMVDAICRIPRLPERGEGVVCSERVMRLGGCAFNSGNVVRQLGVPCFLLAPVGCGVHADFVRSELAALGLAALEVETQLDCGVCTCLVEPDGERTMITAPGIEREFSPAWFEDVDTEGFGALLASGYEIEGAGGDAIIGFAESRPELEFYYAPGPRIMGVDAGKHERINALRPVWHLNDLEALQYTGAESIDAAGEAIARACGNACVITCGDAGARAYLVDGSRAFAPSVPVEVGDTVGAGDAHLGALAAARAAGRPWEESLAIANAAAAVVCSVVGGTASDEAFVASGVRL